MTQSIVYGTVALLGDSILFGARSRSGGPAELLAPLLNNHPNRAASDRTQWACLNRSVSGETTLEILRRTPAVVRELAAMAGAKRLVVMCGTNDSKLPPLHGEEYERLLKQILHWPERYGIETTLCLLPPVDADAMPTFAAKSNTYITIFNNKIKRLRDGWLHHRLPLRLADLSVLTREDFCDGVHLSDDGCRRVAQMLADVMMGVSEIGARFAVPEERLLAITPDELRRQADEAVRATGSRRIVSVLQKAEWGDQYFSGRYDEDPACPVCGGKRGEGHAEGCDLQALLKSLEVSDA